MINKKLTTENIFRLLKPFDLTNDEESLQEEARINSLSYEELISELRSKGKDVDAWLKDFRDLKNLINSENAESDQSMDGNIIIQQSNVSSINVVPFKTVNKNIKTLYEEEILPLAASDDSLQEAGIEFDLKGIEGCISSEKIPNDPAHFILQFKCENECIEKFVGREIVIEIGEFSYNLGKISRIGIAEAKVPAENLDMLQKIRILIL